MHSKENYRGVSIKEYRFLFVYIFISIYLNNIASKRLFVSKYLFDVER